MTIRNRVRYCDRCGESLRGADYLSAAGLDVHFPDPCPREVDETMESTEVEGSNQ